MAIELSQLKEKREKRKGKSSFYENIIKLLNTDISFKSSKLSDKKKERFYAELQILLSSGIDIKSAFDIIVDEQTKKQDKELFSTISNKVLKGVSVSKALEESKMFSPYEYYSLQIGEESGEINRVLEELAQYFAKRIKQKRQLTNAFSYPVLVLITALAAVFFMMNYMVPMFVDVFSRFHGELPALTKFIVQLSAFTNKYFIVFVLIIIGLFVVRFIVKKHEWYRKLAGIIILRLPFWGNITKMIYFERMAQSMALLISSRTPLLNAVHLVRNMIVFYPYVKALEVIEHDIMKGKHLYESMAKFSLFDKRVISLIKVAEEVNQLDTIFEKLSKQYSEELEYKLSVLSSLLEPFLIIFVGLIVGIILIAMYLPMFQLSTSIY